jgi:hypothetical protein
VASWRPASHWSDFDLNRERNLDRWANRVDIYNPARDRYETDDPGLLPAHHRVKLVKCAGCGTERPASNPSCDCCGLTDWQDAA